MQALERGFRIHRQVQNKPPGPYMHAPRNEEDSASRIRKKTPEEDAGRRVLSEALEEDAALRPSDVHVAQSTGLPNRRSQDAATRMGSRLRDGVERHAKRLDLRVFRNQ